MHEFIRKIGESLGTSYCFSHVSLKGNLLCFALSSLVALLLPTPRFRHAKALKGSDMKIFIIVIHFISSIHITHFVDRDCTEK